MFSFPFSSCRLALFFVFFCFLVARRIFVRARRPPGHVRSAPITIHHCQPPLSIHPPSPFDVISSITLLSTWFARLAFRVRPITHRTVRHFVYSFRILVRFRLPLPTLDTLLLLSPPPPPLPPPPTSSFRLWAPAPASSSFARPITYFGASRST